MVAKHPVIANKQKGSHERAAMVIVALWTMI
jgi:hypothetical protein